MSPESHMAEIIAFKPRAAATAADREFAPNGARILFFTGVRYERLQDATPEPAKRSPRSGPRKPGRRRRA